MPFRSALGLVLAAVACLLVYVSLWIFRDPKSQGEALQSSREVATIEVQRCEHCHPGGGPPDAAHAVVACTDCHLGDPMAFEEAPAHRGMEAEPGALDTALQTCGRTGCHSEETTRVASSIMNTAAGIVSVNRWAGGEIDEPNGTQTMASVLAKEHPTPMEDYTRKRCGGCHLGARRDNRDDAIVTGGSGCGACHVEGGKRTGSTHQPIDGVVPDSRCLGCHSRSGRISLSYQGLAEVTGVECDAPIQLLDGRAGCQLEADVHREAGMKCVDCHVHTELMGDGTAHSHKEDQLELTCSSCHSPEAPSVTWGDIDDDITERILELRGQERPESERVRLGARGTPIWNLRPDAAGLRLLQKGSDQSWQVPLTPNDPRHTLKGHERLDCSGCHAKWAPVCSDCHVEYDGTLEQWDFGEGKTVLGGWRESTVHQGWGAPALAVVDEQRIVPAVPGMIMTVSPGKTSDSDISRRLYSTLEPHTTARQGRTCAECHWSPFALGLGSGSLEFARGSIDFEPKDPDAVGLASDRWTTLDARKPAQGTRTGVVSLGPDELVRVLGVGRCVSCHESPEDAIYRDFTRSSELSGQALCTGPAPLSGK